MAACWRALHQVADIEVFVIAFQAHVETAFSDQLMQGIPCRLLNFQERQDARLIKQLVLTQDPDVIVLAGWLNKAYTSLAFLPELNQAAFVMGMDTPWWGTWKQHLAPWMLRSYLRRIDRVVVTGERSWQYARHLGVAPAHIQRGVYGIDYNSWSSLWEQRGQVPWPRSFLFVGRYVTAKAVDILAEAYRNYRSQVTDPWTLVCCGQGPLASYLDQPGIENHGFVQPTEMPSIWRSAGAFILPSRFDPWPLALLEAAAAGLPIVCTDACGSAVETVRPWYNGLMIPENDPDALTNAFIALHQHYDELPTWGIRSQQLAAPYAAEMWAIRWQAMIQELQKARVVQ